MPAETQRASPLSEMTGILFLCVANSARSQMAEGLARAVAGPQLGVWSAGSQPAGLNPLAVRVLAEVGIDIAHHRSKALRDVPLEHVRRVITLCAEEVCPVLPPEVDIVHAPLPDPAAVEGSLDERLAAFRSVRDQLRDRLPGWLEGLDGAGAP